MTDPAAPITGAAMSAGRDLRRIGNRILPPGALPASGTAGKAARSGSGCIHHIDMDHGTRLVHALEPRTGSPAP